MFSLCRPLIICTTLVVLRTATAFPQSRADSAEIARAIVSRAIKDAQRQSSDIRYLSFTTRSQFSRGFHGESESPESAETGVRLLTLASTSQLVQEAGSPVCPW